MLLSAVSVLVVAQSSSEIPEGLMNNPVLTMHGPLNVKFSELKVTNLFSVSQMFFFFKRSDFFVTQN